MASEEIDQALREANHRVEMFTTRLLHVTREFLFFNDETQTHLMSTACFWVFASLAEHDKRSTCHSAFTQSINLMYRATDAAKACPSSVAHESLHESAYDQWLQRYNAALEVSVDSFKQLMRLADSHPFRRSAIAINLASGIYWGHLQEHGKSELLVHCIHVCLRCGFPEWSWGEENQADVGAALAEIELATESARRVVVPVKQALSSGRLKYENGKIVNPFQLDDDDEYDLDDDDFDDDDDDDEFA